MNFSVVIIARNEEKTLPRMIKSLEEFQRQNGEIIILDTGSTDNTPALARSLGCKVTEVGDRFITAIDDVLAKKINQKFIIEQEPPVVKGGDKLFDYSGARNFAASLASNDMIATPDCDEVYTQLDLGKIQEAISNGAEQLEYNFVFSHDSYGKELIKFLHSKFYNRKKARWVGIVHEVLSGNTNRIFLDESIIKLEHWQNPSDHRSNYITGLALDCYLNPNNDRNSHYFAREMGWLGRPKSAIKEFKRHIGFNKPGWFEGAERAQSMIHIGDAYGILQETEKQIEAYQKAFTMDPSRRESLIKLADLYLRKQDFQHAACYASASLEIGENNFYANFADHYRDVPHRILCWSKWYLGDKEGSKYHYDKARSYSPLNSEYLHNYPLYYQVPIISIIAPVLGRLDGTKKLLESIERLNYPKDKIETIIIEDNPRKGVPLRVKEGLEKSTGDYIVYAANDMEFHPDCLILAFIKSTQEQKGLIAFNSGTLYPDGGNKCEHFMIIRRLISLIGGEIFDTELKHVGVDNLLWAKCSKLNQAIRCEEAIVFHHHFASVENPSVMDETYEKGWASRDEDRKVLARKLQELEISGQMVLPQVTNTQLTNNILTIQY